ncbi:hypothetical protein VOLCADRAFT_88331 [Volvox carteri f. nagariensis]|uniref:Uncharacterized protein n=1 Tax=Volvox carteri f. nagariensis TaxID=3068 RepID=D8TNX1_VOLCA|nr:uncharacterized protein VOLCADRAFT_88331 [Volvox carteri f. nagariensis]EFJ51065.1 hypothetical protein VOLCADRAFT_88331 [Volvox carteri f. nagariensis]|eukprot:XP_002948077.1 hypothetical protein VOLCADRAFT_88331 [Volvox carteri f. nagariensis]
MDALLAVAVEEIALEGQEGCTAEELWTLLGARLPVGSITCLPPQLQDVLWGLLLQRMEDVQFFTMPSLNDFPCFSSWRILPCRASKAVDEVEEAEPKKSKGKRAKKKSENNPMAKAIVLSPDDPQIRTHATAAANGVKVMASEAVRFSVLGVYEIQDSRFPLSDMQLAALAVVGRTRWKGTINADLANRLGIAYRNFYYIIKNLETRKLVVKNPVVFAPPGATVTVSSVLHLPRFQPAVKLGPGQMFKTIDAVRGMEVATYVLQDDNMYMRLVCSTIAETTERVVVESDLKLVCGFRGTRGHRLWRRLRRKMEEQGYLAFETCRVRERLVPCVRLLKDWKPPTAADRDEPPEGAGEEGEEADEDDMEGAGGRACIHVTELSLERQLLEGIMSAGPDGVLNHELFSKLGVSSKVYGRKLVDIIKRFNLQVTVVNRGRTVLNRLVAPPELLAAAGHLLQPPAGPPAVDAAGGVAGGAAARTAPAVEELAQGAVATATAAGGEDPSRTLAAAAPAAAAGTPAGAAAPAAAGATKAAGKTKSTGTKSKGKTKGKAKKDKADAADGAAAATAALVAAETPAGRPKRSAAVKASQSAAAVLKALGGVDAGDSDDEYDAEADASHAMQAGESSSGGSSDKEEEDASEESSEELEAEEEEEEEKDEQPCRGRRGPGRPPKRPRITEDSPNALAAAPAAAAVALTPAPAPTPAAVQLDALAAATAATAGAAAGERSTGTKERKPHWTKVITLKTEDRLRLLLEHLNKHRFIPRVQVRRLVMEWESAASGKPIPNSSAGPDIKTIRRLMIRLAESGKAKLIRVETQGFLGDNRPVDTLIRPDLEPTPELLDEICKQMGEFERKLRSECCRKALAARKAVTMIEYPVGNLLPEAMVTAAVAAGSATAVAVAAAEAAAAGAAGGGGAAAAGGAVGTIDGLDETTAGLLGAVGLDAGNEEPGLHGRDGGGGSGGGGAVDRGRGGTQSPATAAAAARLRIGRGVSLFRAVHNEATARSVENGLIPAKMVRVRLLHYLIAKLVGRWAGLGGFESDSLASVDPEPGGMPHMPLSWGEEVLSLASATERSKMAFAFGAMKGSSAQGDPQKQQQQGQPGQGQGAQQGQQQGVAEGGGERAAGGAAGGPGEGGDGEARGGGGGGGGVEVTGATARQEAPAAPMRHLSVRRLWSIMPLSVALQVLGSTSRRHPEELARLCESGATLGSLTPDQARNIMDGTSVHRLEYLISILRRLRLLEWAVVDPSRLEASRKPGPGAGVRARDGQGVRLLVHARGVLEIPPGKELSHNPPQPPPAQPATGVGAEGAGHAAAAPEVAAGTAAGGGGGGGGGTPPVVVAAPTGFTALAGGSGRFVEVDLSTSEGLDEYWRRFEELYRLTGSAHAEVQRLRRCFPATTVPEVLSSNSWYGQRLMTAVQWLRLQAGLENIDLADGKQITNLAAQLGIDVDVVARIVSDKRRRLNRLTDPGAAEGGSAEEGDDDTGGGVPLRLARLAPAAVHGQGPAGQGKGGRGVGAISPGVQGAADEALPAEESPTSRERRAAEEAARKAARKALRVAKREEKEAAKAARRAMRASGTFVVRRRSRAEMEAAEAAGLHRRKRRRVTGKEDEDGAGGEGGSQEQQQQQQQRRKRAYPVPSTQYPVPSTQYPVPSTQYPVPSTQTVNDMSRLILPSVSTPPHMIILSSSDTGPAQPASAAQLAARDGALAAVGPGRDRLHGALFMLYENAAAAAAGGGGGEDEHHRRRGSDTDGGDGGGGLGPAVRMPDMAAPSRVTRILWTASEDRVLLTEYVKLAAEVGPHVRLPWKTRAAVLPYSITICIRHIRYLKRHYPSYTGRLDELLRRAHERKAQLQLITTSQEARTAAYAERLRRRQAGEPVRPLGPDGYEVQDDPKPQLPRDPLHVTRVIVGSAAGEGRGLEEVEEPEMEISTAATVAATEADVLALEAPPADPEEALMKRLSDEEGEKKVAIEAEREAVIAEALALVEDFVLVMPRRISQKKRELMQQRGDLDLGEMPAQNVTNETQVRRRTAAAVRRSLGGTLQEVEAAAAIGDDEGGGDGDGAAAAANPAGPSSVAPARSRRPGGSGAATGGRLILQARLALPQPSAVPPPSVSVTAAICMLVSLLFSVRAAGGAAAWASNLVMEALADFGRRFSADVKTAALKQMQLRGWLARSGPRRQLELTPAFMNRLTGVEIPQGLLGRCASAAGRMDELLAQARRAAHRQDSEEMDVDAVAPSPQDRASGGDGGGDGDGDRTGVDAVERSCTVDAARGALVLEAQDQLPSELVAVVLARQALGQVELLPGAVNMQPDWAGQAATAGILLTSVQLLVVPQQNGSDSGNAARGGLAGCLSVVPQPAPAAGTRLAVTADGSAAAATTNVAAPSQPRDGTSDDDKAEEDGKEEEDKEEEEEEEGKSSHLPPKLQQQQQQQPRPHRDGGVTSATRAQVGIEFQDPDPDPRLLNSGGPPQVLAPLFKPSMVASVPSTRAAARAASRAYLATEAPSCQALMEELAEAVETLLEVAADSGLTVLELSSKLHEAASSSGLVLGTAQSQNGGVGSPAATVVAPSALMLSSPPSQRYLSLVLRALELHGLVWRVAGWDEVRFLAAQHCQDAVLEVVNTDAAAPAELALQPEGTAAASSEADQAAQAACSATGTTGTSTTASRMEHPAKDADAGITAAAAGTGSAPVRQRVLRPWLDYRGSVNEQMWGALLQRVLGLVMRHPGIPEELLVASIDVIPPQACRELLQHLAKHGRVEARTTVARPQQQHRPRRPLLLLLGDGRGGGVGAGGGEGGAGGRPVVPSVHYFPVLEQYAGSGMLTLPPP